MNATGNVFAHYPDLAYGLLFLLQIAFGGVVGMSVYTFKREIASLKEADYSLEQRITQQLTAYRSLCGVHDARISDFERNSGQRFQQLAAMEAHIGDIGNRLDRLETKIDKLLGLNGKH